MLCKAYPNYNRRKGGVRRIRVNIFGLIAAVFVGGGSITAQTSPLNISASITIEKAPVDPALGGPVITGIKVSNRVVEFPGNDSLPTPDWEPDRVFGGDLLILPEGFDGLTHSGIYNPFHNGFTRPGILGPYLSTLNRFRAFFSSASGGFGLRIGYDRRVLPDLRLTAGTEMLTYGYAKAADILGADLPEGVTRITLMSLPLGLQQQFGASTRIVPHIGVAVGPILRFDHRPGLAPGFYPTYTDIRTGQSGSSLRLAVNPLDDFPTISLTFGGFVEAGSDIRFGADRDLVLTVSGRYGYTRFPDALGSPGDFSGVSLAVGFGKYF